MFAAHRRSSKPQMAAAPGPMPVAASTTSTPAILPCCLRRRAGKHGEIQVTAAVARVSRAEETEAEAADLTKPFWTVCEATWKPSSAGAAPTMRESVTSAWRSEGSQAYVQIGLVWRPEDCSR